MSTVSLKNASLSGAVKSNSLLAGNVAFEPFTSDFDLLETTVLGSSASSVTFTGLGSYTDYKHLQIRSLVKTTSTINSGLGWDRLVIELNTDTTGANYRTHTLQGNTPSGTLVSYTDANVAKAAGIGARINETNTFGGNVTDLLDAFSSSKNTTVRTLGGMSASGAVIALQSGLYINTASLAHIKIFSEDGAASLATGSRFSLYGVR